MTCIIGLIDNRTKSSYIGADSLATGGGMKFKEYCEKLFPWGEDYVIAYTGSPRDLQIVRYLSTPPKIRSKLDIEFVVTKIIPVFRSALIENGSVEKLNEKESIESMLILARGESVFVMEDNYQIGICKDYVAHGSGREFALGSLYTTRKEKDPIKRILTALKAAAEHSDSVSGPFMIIRSSVHDGQHYTEIQEFN